MIPDSGPKPETKLAVSPARGRRPRRQVWLPILGLPEALVARPANGRRSRRRFAQVKALTPAEYAAAQVIAALVQK